MLDIRYTTRLMYNRFVYQVNLAVVLPPTTRLARVTHREKEVALFDIRRWLSEKCQNGHRTYASWRRKMANSSVDDRKTFVHVCYFNLYLRERADFEAFLDEYRDQAVGIMFPLNAEHEELLKSGTHVEIRDKLFYHRFRYRINFRGGWSGHGRKNIIDTVRTHLHDHSKRKQDYLLSSADCTLYLTHQHDLMVIKLTMPELITKLTMVNTLSEAGLSG